MTIKIIECGTLPAEREWKAQCYTCRTRFECHQSDGILSHNQHDGSTLEVPCPVCGAACYGSLK